MTWAWMFGPTELILVLLALLLLFGARRVPELARSLGRSLSEFKKGRVEGEKEVSDTLSSTSSNNRENGKNETDKHVASSNDEGDSQAAKRDS